jgi:Alr-MurF fusion protein
MKYSIQEINTILQGRFLQESRNDLVSQVCTDTRNITSAHNSLFFCLIARNDGHAHIESAYNKGILNFIVSKPVKTEQFPRANFILVENTLAALQQLAHHHRKQFSIPVIAITGSNGKTIVKEWLYQLLSKTSNVVKSPKSYNSQIGVPLSVLNMEPEHELAIFEAGISTTGEMQQLQHIIQPTIGIFTNIGPAHDAGFTSTEEKINEKLLLFQNADKIIYCADQSAVNKAMDAAPLKALRIAWKNAGSDKHSRTVTVVINTAGVITTSVFQIPFQDNASIENCLHCIALLKELGYDNQTIQDGISALRNLPMRLELKYGINNCTIIDDSYSADFLSLQIAVDFLKQQETNKKKTLILSDFEESGLSDKAYISKLQTIIKDNNFEKLIGVGPQFKKNIEYLASYVKEWYVFESTKQLQEQFSILQFQNEFILLKGARRFEFEKIMQLLIGQTHATVLEINLNALTHNLNVYRNCLTESTGIIAMVKAFSYGSGSVEVASLLEKQHVDYLAVAYADEGVELRRNGIRTPIMVMNPDAVDFDRMLEFELEPEIYSLHILQQLIQKTGSRHIAVHLKVETGMNRLGFTEEELNELTTMLVQHPNISVKTIFSHLAASEDAQLDEFTLEQIGTFERLSAKISAALNYPVKKHLLNSSGIIRFPEAHYDFVRLGIGLYGVDSSSTIQAKLQVIGKLKTRIAQIKHVSKGETIGYSRKGVAEKDLKIAVLAIGYADGYDRRFGNGVGEVFIAGHRAKIIGNICMDMCMADITAVEEVQEGDEAEIYGNEISIIEQAKKIGTISYELLTRISSRVKRLYYLD